ncbi:MAG: arylsulfatase A-like enzyme [Cyclobacteriaceae bacterium]|jgi:arylsulfatase A-like enzyme
MIFQIWRVCHCIVVISMALLFITSCNNSNKEESNQPPNIVIILTDDQGWGDLGISGNTNISTPNIDQLANEGVIFDRFYVSPVCSPTRAELLTGRYHVRGGVCSTGGGGERLDLDETTIADIFKEAGYKTGAFGKWHNGMQYPYHPNARGFDEYYGFCSGHWGNYFDPMLEHNGKLVKGAGFIIDDFTNKALEFIDKNKEDPFLVYLPYNTPHSPMQVPDEWWDKYKNKDLVKFSANTDKEDVQFTKAALAMCENIDWNVGRLTSKLTELGLDDNTIVIYLSDNGPNSWRWNDEMKGRKGSTDEGGVRSPLIMKWKGQFDSGKTVAQIASVRDLLPTFTDLANLKPVLKNKLDGVSLKPLLFDVESEWEDQVIINNWKKKTSVRTQQFLLGHENKLFDMINDPNQTNDISKDHIEEMAKLMQTKNDWQQQVYSELPEKDTRTFSLGHPDAEYTQIPARDGVAHGNIKRSNRWPNCSFFANWLSTEDQITWEVEVLEGGQFEVELYYSCGEENVGSVIELSFGDNKLQKEISESHDPRLTGMENDKIVRQESYVKDFKPLNMGLIDLKKGKGQLVLKALDIPGSEVIDFRLMMFRRVDAKHNYK